MTLPTITRRTALKRLALASASLPLAGGLTSLRAADSPAPKPQPAFHFGVATVTLKSLPLDNALAAVRRVGLDSISLHRAHSPWENSPAAWQATAEKIKASGITVHCCGVIALKNDEPAMRRMFEYVKILGVPLFSCSPEVAALPLLERLVKEYDVRAAIHNHGPEDKVWPSPKEVWEKIQSLDSRIGLCLDVGHSYRAGMNPVDAIHLYRTRLFDLHLKDSTAAVGAEDIPIEIGRGVIDVHAILTTLIETGYDKNVWFEYEKDPNDPVAGLAESIGYTKGLLKGIS